MTPWYVFALSGAFLDGLYYTLIKKSVSRVNRFVAGAGIFFTAFFTLFCLSWLRSFPAIQKGYWLILVIMSVLGIVANLLSYRSLEITELSLAVPMLSFTPIFLLLTSYLMLKESPSLLGLSGILLIVAGSYVLNLTLDSQFDLLKPIKKIFQNKGTAGMLGVALIFSIMANFNKMLVQKSDPIFALALLYLLYSLSFIGIAKINRVKAVRKLLKENTKPLIIGGLVLAGVAATINAALAKEIVPYVTTTKRVSILFSVILGKLVFKEKEIFKRFIGAVLMLIGVGLIVRAGG
jgi:drug/metabolite transporter (DMT)-like permease